LTDDPQHRTILIVDDNLDICAFAKKFLEAAGYSVATAAGGAEGLRVYQEHQSNIVLLVTDVVMPDISGVELADRVLGIDAQLPVLFMTGGTWRPYRGLECIAKPFRSAELVASVSRVLKANVRSEATASAA
jgi:two-component system cell cycle sensor histidine kinase/response regulator CckA